MNKSKKQVIPGAPQQADEGYPLIVEVDCEEQRNISPLIGFVIKFKKQAR